MFPVLMDQKEKERLSKYSIPDQLPIAFVNQFKKQIEKNHDQSIEKLAERGGLHPRELIAAIYGISLQTYFGKVQEQLSDEQTIFAINLITLKLKDFEKNEKKHIQTKENI